MSKYTTGEIAKLCDVSVRTVQYYDARGILVPEALSEGGRRLYSEEDLSRMKIICFLRELDISIENIARILREENSGEVISLIFEEQKRALREELDQKQDMLERLEDLIRQIKKSKESPLDSIGDIAHVMKRKNDMKRLRTILLLSAIPMEIAEVTSIVLWIASGIWWPFLVYTLAMIPCSVWIIRYYFSRVSYLCPQCHQEFQPRISQFVFARHTWRTRRLSCTKCGYHGFCVETYRREEKHGKAD